MVVYNITVKVESAVATAFIAWMQEEYMPLVISTGNFESGRLLRLLETDDSDGPTYAVQFTAPSAASYREYRNRHAENHQQIIGQKWAGRYVSFSSVMELVR